MLLEPLPLCLCEESDCFLFTCCKKVIFFIKHIFFAYKTMISAMFKNESYLKNMIYKFLG